MTLLSNAPSERTSSVRAERYRLAFAGTLSASVALGTSELVAALNRRAPSLVVAVGDWVIDAAPRALVDDAITSLGAAAKATLVVGVVVVALALGALLGSASRLHSRPVVLGFAAAGLVGAVAGLRQTWTSPVLAFAAAVVAAESGVARSGFFGAGRPSSPLLPLRPRRTLRAVDGS